MSEPLCGECNRVTRVCIDGYERVLEGRIYQYNSEFQDGICFRGTIDFLRSMEQIMKITHCPDYQEYRTFHQNGERELVKPSPETKRIGQKATFVIKVLFCQLNSWQGTVMWCEKNKEERFRSVLELLVLMDSALR